MEKFQSYTKLINPAGVGIVTIRHNAMTEIHVHCDVKSASKACVGIWNSGTVMSMWSG